MTDPSDSDTLPLAKDGTRTSKVDASVETMLAEYNTLRSEIVTAFGHQLIIINFTFAGLLLLIAGLLSGEISDLWTGLISLVVVPQLAKCALLIWLGEYTRSQRASRWLADLEERINTRIGTDAMRWERHFRDEDGEPRLVYPHVATTCLVLGTAYVATILGAVLLFDGLRTIVWGSDIVTIVLLAAYVLPIEVPFLRFFLRKWRACLGLPAPSPRAVRDKPDDEQRRGYRRRPGRMPRRRAIVAVGTIAAVAVGGLALARSQSDQVEVAVMKRSLPAYRSIHRQDVKLRKVPADRAGPDVVRAVDALVGHYLVVSAAPGAIVRRASVGPRLASRLSGKVVVELNAKRFAALGAAFRPGDPIILVVDAKRMPALMLNFHRPFSLVVAVLAPNLASVLAGDRSGRLAVIAAP